MRPALLTFAFAMTALAVNACTDTPTPTDPQPTPNQPSIGPDFAWVANSWAARAPMPTGRHGVGVGVVKNAAGESILYAIGGDVGGQSGTVVEAYNYVTNSWSTKAPLPARLKRPAGVAVIAGKIYYAGGALEVPFDAIKGFPYLFVYNPANNTWTRKADMPKPAYEGVGGAINGKFYVVLGTELIRYDPATNRWQTGLPRAPYSHFGGGAGVINGKLYVAGGYGSNKLDVYDPATNKWTTKASLPAAREWTAGAVLGSKLYIIGGQSQGTLASVVAYDPATNKWVTKASMIRARDMLSAATIVAFGNSKIIALGGRGNNINEAGPEWMPYVEAYKP